MMKLPHATETRHPRVAVKIERHEGLINYDRARMLMFDETLTQWSAAEIDNLVNNLVSTTGIGMGYSPLDIDPDVEDNHIRY